MSSLSYKPRRAIPKIAEHMQTPLAWQHLPDLSETWDKAGRCGFNGNADLFCLAFNVGLIDSVLAIPMP